MQPHMNKREIYAPHSRPRFFASISASCLACTATSGATPRNAVTRGTRGRGWCSRWTIAFPKTVREHFPRPRVPRPFRNPRPRPSPTPTVLASYPQLLPYVHRKHSLIHQQTTCNCYCAPLIWPFALCYVLATIVTFHCRPCTGRVNSPRSHLCGTQAD